MQINSLEQRRFDMVALACLMQCSASVLVPRIQVDVAALQQQVDDVREPVPRREQQWSLERLRFRVDFDERMREQQADRCKAAGLNCAVQRRHMIPRLCVHITFLADHEQKRPHISRDGAHAAICDSRADARVSASHARFCIVLKEVIAKRIHPEDPNPSDARIETISPENRKLLIGLWPAPTHRKDLNEPVAP
jgi:hypothetical protein